MVVVVILAVAHGAIYRQGVPVPSRARRRGVGELQDVIGAALGGEIYYATWSGQFAEVMRRIAVPMVGGMISSTVLTLILIPAIYTLVKERGLKRRHW